MRDIFDALREAMPAVGATAGATAGAAGAADEKQAQGLAELASAVSGDTASLGGGAVSGGAAAAAGAKGESSVAIIHCTHGLNRTGYVVARALVELHGYTLVDALDAFAAIRSPGLWREEYVRDLRGRYGGPQPTLPTPPAWAKLEPHSSGGGHGGYGGKGGGGGHGRGGYGG